MNEQSKDRFAVVHVKLKDGVLDPQGSTIQRALDQMGYQGIKQVRSGKIFEITFRENGGGTSEELIDEICRKLLTNPVIENFNFEILK